MNKTFLSILFSFLSITIFAQNMKPSLGIIEFKTVGLDKGNEEITDVVRFEIEKSQKYKLLDKDEMEVKFAQEKINPDNCFNQICLVFTGKTLLVDKMLSGSVSKLGDNKLVTFKLYDMKSESLEVSKKIEIIHDEGTSINKIINKSLDEFLNGSEKFVTLNLKEKTAETAEIKQVIKEEPKPIQYTSNQPPVEPKLQDYGSFFDEEPREKESRFPKMVIYTRPTTLLEFFPKSTIGLQYSLDDLTAFKFQYAYMFETNRDVVRATFGAEPGIYSGYEFRGEFIFRIPQDYFDYENIYSRFYISMEGGFHKKFHKEARITSYQDIGNVTYNAAGIRSRVIVGNVKMGIQNVFSDRIYLDPYIGLGVRTHSYSSNFNSFGQGNYNMNLQNRTLPNMVLGFDFGVVIK